MSKLRHPEWTAVWPQSGEVVRNTEDDRATSLLAIRAARRMLVPSRLVGSEDHWVTSPLGGAYRVSGEGDVWWGEWQMTYPGRSDVVHDHAH